MTAASGPTGSSGPSRPQQRGAVAVLDDYQGVAMDVADWTALAGRLTVSAYHDHVDDPDALADRLAPFAVVVAMRERTPLPRDLLTRLPNLRLIVSTGMRNKSIDLAAARDLGIVVSGTDLGGSSTVELAWALIMAVSRDIPGEDRRTRAGQWQSALPVQLEGSTLGILGLGRIGQRIAAIAGVFGMTVLAWSENLTVEAAAAHGARRVDRNELFERSDIVTIHTLLSHRTRGLVGAADLALLGPAGYLVNTSRGPIVVERALIAALRDGIIGGAALDVFDVEPLPAGHPLLSTPRTILSPHVGFVSRRSYQVAYGQAVEDIEAWLAGGPIRLLS